MLAVSGSKLELLSGLRLQPNCVPCQGQSYVLLYGLFFVLAVQGTVPYEVVAGVVTAVWLDCDHLLSCN